MLIHQLWRYLKTPPEDHPQYRYVLRREATAPPWYVLGVEVVGLLLFIPFVLFTDTIYGLSWAIGISGELSSKRQRRVFDLLATTPDGALYMSWLTALACLYRNKRFSYINQTGINLARAVGTGLVLTPLLIREGTPTLEEWMVLAAYVMVFFATFPLDHIQSIVLSCVVGMFAGTGDRSRADAQFLAFGSFLLIQLGSYIAALSIGFVVLPQLTNQSGLMGWVANILPPIAALGTLYVLRTVIILRLWRNLQIQLNADTIEIFQKSA